MVPSNHACCMRFKTRREYNTHRTKCHSWTCPGCDTINTGLTYPRCWVCGNSRGTDGVDLVAKLKADVTKTLFRFNHPELFDDDEDDEGGEGYDDEGNALEEDDSLDDESGYGLEGGIIVNDAAKDKKMLGF